MTAAPSPGFGAQQQIAAVQQAQAQAQGKKTFVFSHLFILSNFKY